MIDSGAITALGAGVLLFCCSFKGDRSPEICQKFLNADTLRSECNNLLHGANVLQNGLTLEETAHGKGVDDDGEDALTEFSFKRNVRCKCTLNETDNAIAHCKMFSKHLTDEEGDIMCRAFLPAEQFGFVSMGGRNEDMSSEYNGERYRQEQRQEGWQRRTTPPPYRPTPNNYMQARPRPPPPHGPYPFHPERQDSDDRSRRRGPGPIREWRGPPPGSRSRFRDDGESNEKPVADEENANETTANPEESTTTTVKLE